MIILLVNIYTKKENNKEILKTNLERNSELREKLSRNGKMEVLSLRYRR